GAMWTQIVGNGPQARWNVSIAFDPIRRVYVLHGGWASPAYYNDDWEFDGASWSQITPYSGSPEHYSLFFDPVRADIMLLEFDGSLLKYNRGQWSNVTVIGGGLPVRGDFLPVPYDSDRSRFAWLLPYESGVVWEYGRF